MKYLLFFLAINSLSCFGQTKKIFHKSHSGKSTTLFLDKTNSYGPGIQIPRYRVREQSNIKLSYKSGSKFSYPKVLLDTAVKTMRFLDVFDSLIGCNRNYTEYLNEGDLVYDVISNKYYLFQKYVISTSKSKFLDVTDSIFIWESRKGVLRKRVANIFTHDNKSIKVIYTMLNYNYAIQLKQNPSKKKDAYPVKVSKKIKRENKRLQRKESRKERKKKRKAKRAEKEKRNSTVLFVPNEPPNKTNSVLGIGVLFFLILTVIAVFKVRKLTMTELSNLK